MRVPLNSEYWTWGNIENNKEGGEKLFEMPLSHSAFHLFSFYLYSSLMWAREMLLNFLVSKCPNNHCHFFQVCGYLPNPHGAQRKVFIVIWDRLSDDNRRYIQPGIINSVLISRCILKICRNNLYYIKTLKTTIETL